MPRPGHPPRSLAEAAPPPRTFRGVLLPRKGRDCCPAPPLSAPQGRRSAPPPSARPPARPSAGTHRARPPAPHFRSSARALPTGPRKARLRQSIEAAANPREGSARRPRASGPAPLREGGLPEFLRVLGWGRGAPTSSGGLGRSGRTRTFWGITGAVKPGSARPQTQEGAGPGSWGSWAVERALLGGVGKGARTLVPLRREQEKAVTFD